MVVPLWVVCELVCAYGLVVEWGGVGCGVGWGGGPAAQMEPCVWMQVGTLSSAARPSCAPGRLRRRCAPIPACSLPTLPVCLAAMQHTEPLLAALPCPPRPGLQFDPAPRRGEPEVTRRTPDYFL